MKKSFIVVLFFLFAGTCFAQQNRRPVEVKVTVGAGKIWSAPFVVKADNTKYKVGFDVANKRDIVVFVTDASNFKRFLDGRQFLVNYQSDKAESGLIDINLPRGNFVLVVSNQHATFYSKDVFLTFF